MYRIQPPCPCPDPKEERNRFRWNLLVAILVPIITILLGLWQFRITLANEINKAEDERRNRDTTRTMEQARLFKETSLALLSINQQQRINDFTIERGQLEIKEENISEAENIIKQISFQINNITNLEYTDTSYLSKLKLFADSIDLIVKSIGNSEVNSNYLDALLVLQKANSHRNEYAKVKLVSDEFDHVNNFIDSKELIQSVPFSLRVNNEDTTFGYDHKNDFELPTAKFLVSRLCQPSKMIELPQEDYNNTEFDDKLLIAYCSELGNYINKPQLLLSKGQFWNEAEYLNMSEYNRYKLRQEFQNYLGIHENRIKKVNQKAEQYLSNIYRILSKAKFDLKNKKNLLSEKAK